MYFSSATIVRAALFIVSVEALALPDSKLLTIKDNSDNGASSQELESLLERATAPPHISFSLTGQKLADGTFVIKPEPAQEDENAVALTTRQASPYVVAIAGPAINLVGSLVAAAITAAVTTLVATLFWDIARESFTKGTVDRMWNGNPDRSKFGAAICYNKGYSLKRPAGIDGRRNAKLSHGLLSTDYDCMFMEYNNQFYTESDGGYINLAYAFDGSRCSHDRSTGDLTCN
ncbi:hypothetical protein BKA65DRAFT_580829 [Rhexocercosporidium sp. MPI-PUGE-AT-0058]|nr:hypothetical protein BKA65DRAFT_580829 [Rhexocercosporidium sp. MPI-PUGE-AT-0058]